MHETDLILTLTASLGVALLLGFLALRLGLPAIVGYLLAGLLVGPHTPGFVANRALAEQLAEVGVILLMFGVGLHFHVKDLLAVRRIAVSGALAQIAAATALGAVAGHAFGWTWAASIVFGIALSVASTVVLTRVLAENGDLHSETGRIAIGWLVVEDIFTVFVLVVLPSVFAPGAAGASLAGALGFAAVKLIVLTVLTLKGGGRFIPGLLSKAAGTHSRELFTLAVLVIALGIAVGAAKVFGVSMALGAFLAGMVVGQSEFSYRAASEALPMRDAFAVLFFVAAGMLFDPAHVLRAPGAILITTAIVLIAKPAAAFFAVIVLGYGARAAVRVAVALAQIGEFSFIVAALGGQLGILPEGAMDSLVAASIVSITINPLLYRLAPAADRVLASTPFLRRALAPRLPASVGEQTGTRAASLHAVIVGYGPTGQAVSSLLRQRGIEPVVIELNVDTVRQLTADGMRAVYGDAQQEEILREAGIESAVGLVLSSPASAASADMIRAARESNPRIRVLAQSSYLSQAPALRDAGADQVFSGEAEVAMAMIQRILDDLGATPEQMDSERARVREHLYGSGDTQARS